MNEALTQLATNTEDPLLNFRVAHAYHERGQTAAAISFYLRCAERTSYDELAYICLLQMSKCFAAQKNRNFTVKYLIKCAISILPRRPEGYYYLCKFYENSNENYDCYTASKIALEVCDFSTPALDTLTDYPGKYSFIFLQARAGWHWDKNEETKKLLSLLLNEYHDVMDKNHLTAVQNNLINLNVRLYAAV
jgi:hypothetical protein